MPIPVLDIDESRRSMPEAVLNAEMVMYKIDPEPRNGTYLSGLCQPSSVKIESEATVPSF